MQEVCGWISANHVTPRQRVSQNRPEATLFDQPLEDTYKLWRGPFGAVHTLPENFWNDVSNWWTQYWEHADGRCDLDVQYCQPVRLGLLYKEMPRIPVHLVGIFLTRVCLLEGESHIYKRGGLALPTEYVFEL